MEKPLTDHCNQLLSSENDNCNQWPSAVIQKVLKAEVRSEISNPVPLIAFERLSLYTQNHLIVQKHSMVEKKQIKTDKNRKKQIKLIETYTTDRNIYNK